MVIKRHDCALNKMRDPENMNSLDTNIRQLSVPKSAKRIDHAQDYVALVEIFIRLKGLFMQEEAYSIHRRYCVLTGVQKARPQYCFEIKYCDLSP